jgi:hypothetical protein
MVPRDRRRAYRQTHTSNWLPWLQFSENGLEETGGNRTAWIDLHTHHGCKRQQLPDTPPSTVAQAYRVLRGFPLPYSSAG